MRVASIQVLLMKLVVDANIVFSFFKKDSAPKELIIDPELKYNLELFAPELMLEEVNRHKNEICSKFGVAPKDFDIMFSSLKLFIKIVEKQAFEEFSSKADKILSPHIKDVPYIALSLWFKDKGVEISFWSNETRLKVVEEHGIKVFSTKELVEFLSTTSP